MSAVSIRKDNFRPEVLESEKPVLLDFWAPWCGPCRALAPVLEQFAKENPEIKVCKINVDEETELASQFGVMSVPSLFVLKGGQVVNRAAGVQSPQQLLDLMK